MAKHEYELPDDDAVKERMAEAERSKAHLLAPVAKLGDRLTEEKLAAAEHNAAVLEEHAQVEQARAERARRGRGEAEG